jgi:hypothetical protein
MIIYSAGDSKSPAESSKLIYGIIIDFGSRNWKFPTDSPGWHICVSRCKSGKTEFMNWNDQK